MEDINRDLATEKRISTLYPNVKEPEVQLPRMWSNKDKFSFLSLSSNNLRVHYKGFDFGLYCTLLVLLWSSEDLCSLLIKY